MYTRCLGSLLGNLVASSLVIFGFNNPDHYVTKIVWYGGMIILLGFRTVDVAYWHMKLRHTAYDGVAAKRRFIVGSLATAVMWSVYCVIMFQHMPIIEFATTLIVIASLAGGASTVLSGHKNTASAFVAIIIFPSAIIALMSDQQYHQMLGMLAVFFGITLFTAARKSASFTSDTIQLKNEHAQLIKQMHHEKTEINTVHQELSEAYTKLNQANSSLEEQVQRRTEKIAQLSNMDPLTGLYNRSAFTSQLKDLLRRSHDRGTSLALLFIDLNGFKKINDTLGHKVGDGVLTEIANRIEIFSNDYHAGRWGGDEFLIALPYAEQDAAMSVAYALQTRISHPVDVLSNQLSLGASVGIAMYPEHAEDELELIQLADFAMFEQKRAGHSEPRVFSNDLYQSLKNVQELRDGLQHAINKRQFHLCYQPIVSFESNKPWAFEALLRWKFNGELVRPDIFIQLAEQSGFIKDIGAWVLNRACIDASQWQHQSDASVSVNVSVMQLLDDDFIYVLDKALHTSGLEPSRLHIEITESMFADNKAKVRAQIEAIVERDVMVSIDDFGTGYSSLSQLQTLQFDTIKIDKSFVHNLDQGGEAIIRATMFIAKEFGSKTIAEGIETVEQAKALHQMGVDYLQGFLYAKPMPNDELNAWLKGNEKP